MPSTHYIDSGRVTIREFKVAKLITLDRPKARNALSLNMLSGLYSFYKKWEREENCVILLNSSSSSTFCAGGDVKAITMEPCTAARYFQSAYRLNNTIHNLMKGHRIPHISFIDGLAMGGGLGLTVQGSHRICSENTIAAMPECAIGFYPDVCASYFLPKLRPSGIGHYLALTGDALRGADVVRCGLGTNLVRSDKMEFLISELTKVTARSDAEKLIKAAETSIEMQKFDFASENELQLLEYAFLKHRNVEDVLTALSHMQNQEFTNRIIMRILQNSPISVKVTWELLSRATGAMVDASYADHAKLDYNISQQFLKLTPDFVEGVRAKLIDKTNAPKWIPGALSDIDHSKVEQFFTHDEAQKQLEL